MLFVELDLIKSLAGGDSLSGSCVFDERKSAYSEYEMEDTLGGVAY